jgi:hypothetical protein
MMNVAMRTTWLASLVLLAIPVFALAAQQADSAAPKPRPPKSSSTLITEEDLDRIGPSIGNAFEAVSMLRPRWLRAMREPVQLPGTGSSMRMPVLQVYVDGHPTEMGGIDFLRSLPVEQVYTLRYLSSTEVGARYGPSSGPGIVVTLRH